MQANGGTASPGKQTGRNRGLRRIERVCSLDVLSQDLCTQVRVSARLLKSHRKVTLSAAL